VQWAITKPVEESMYVYRWFGLLAVGMKMFEVSQLESGYVMNETVMVIEWLVSRLESVCMFELSQLAVRIKFSGLVEWRFG